MLYLHQGISIYFLSSVIIEFLLILYRIGVRVLDVSGVHLTVSYHIIASDAQI